MRPWHKLRGLKNRASRFCGRLHCRCALKYTNGSLSPMTFAFFAGGFRTQSAGALTCTRLDSGRRSCTSGNRIPKMKGTRIATPFNESDLKFLRWPARCTRKLSSACRAFEFSTAKQRLEQSCTARRKPPHASHMQSQRTLCRTRGLQADDPIFLTAK